MLPTRSARSARKSQSANLARAVESLEPRSYFAGIGQGLVGNYYSDQAVANIAVARTDPTINFAWTTSPGEVDRRIGRSTSPGRLRQPRPFRHTSTPSAGAAICRRCSRIRVQVLDWAASMSGFGPG